MTPPALPMRAESVGMAAESATLMPVPAASVVVVSTVLVSPQAVSSRAAASVETAVWKE